MYLPVQRRAEPDMRSLALAFAAGAAFGGAVMYALDPQMGRRRRALARDQVVHLGHQAGDLADDARGRGMDLRNRAQGAMVEARGAASGS